ncbi:1,4-dihydroxy-2-naphthoate polyprenyltransferase [Fodinicola acaciae]|uniref:1,4-dihydroxy-2-naphthoate polyprenyltransferase n=1 Tax=Fodinicola acaciae TaxID=2681555 RepID=UPI0013D1E88A|nr:1,4-dihydroxy-2-naphthoate polyprenyltransferase [Fodinicola acaciae]
MATTAQWLEGARPRTLPASTSGVIAGTGAAAALGGFSLWRALLALIVALALQIGVNYANDYSDGIRGTDENRVGPFRLVGSGSTSATSVKYAAFAAFAVAALAGLALVVATQAWWLLVVGVACILAAWYYTGGKRPYGYNALGEVFVFVFFGPVAVLGTTYVQALTISWPALAAAAGIGAYACAILVANNVRDIPTDSQTGKRTLAVLMGDRASRILWAALVILAQVLGIVVAIWHGWAWLSLLGIPMAVRAAGPLLARKTGLALIPTLRDTGLAELCYAIGLAAGLALSATA